MADSKDNSGVMEVVAIAALAFFLWWITRKKVIYIGEPSTTEPEVKDQFSGDPDLNMNDYCQNVVHKPLSTNDLTTSSLLGDGWCFRGDRSAIDESKGFGDAYAEEQADKYAKMKQEEAIFIKNKLCVQFRLINSTSSPITTNLLNTTQNSAPFITVVPATPVAGAATAVGENGFTANWSSAVNASGYYIDIATDISFLSYVSGYLSKDVGDVLTLIVSGIGAGTTYYYRLKAYNDTGESEYSDIITVSTDFIEDEDGNQYSSVIIGSQEWMKENLKTTKYADGTAIPNLIEAVYNNYYLPSKDELDEIYTELYSHGVGNLTNGVYWSSSQKAGGGGWEPYAWVIRFSDHAILESSKDAGGYKTRAIRTFISTSILAIRDEGEAGGLIFHIIDNGDGSYTYYEAAPTDNPTTISWCGVIDVNTEVIGAIGTAIGTGQANTTSILSTVSLPLITTAYNCDTLSLGGWINDTTGAYCYYDNDIANKADYGALYNWYAVDNAHGLAPTGWRVATKADWDSLIAIAGGDSVAGGILKEVGIEHWSTPNTGAVDSYGFAAIPTGDRDAFFGNFGSILTNGSYWTATTELPGRAWRNTMTYDMIIVSSAGGVYTLGSAVRCVRDL